MTIPNSCCLRAIDKLFCATTVASLALKRQLTRVTKERDLLRDAAAFFAKESS